MRKKILLFSTPIDGLLMYSRQFIRTTIRSLALVVSLAMLPVAASAEGVNCGGPCMFVVANGLTQERVDVRRSNTAPLTRSGPSFSTVLQGGMRNLGVTSITRSDGAVGAILQSGERNVSAILIDNSPRSAVASLQLGNDNLARIAVLGGADNLVSALQLGNSLSMEINLINANGTEVVYGQSSESYPGAVSIMNAPVGTIVRVD
jgi:hypothetical protein